jgi:DNA-binding NarL/FixJ family response regulator
VAAEINLQCMENKIRLITVERNQERGALLKKRTANSEILQLVDSVVYSPSIIEEISQADADVFAVDVNLPCNIASFIGDFKKKISPAKILMSCDFVQPDLLVDCLRSGASGYIERNCSKIKLEQTVMDCSENLVHLPLSIIALLYARNIIHEADSALKNLFNLLSKGFLLNDVIAKTGLSEREIKRTIFLSLHS